MKSLASLALLLIAAQEPPPGDGPRGSSALATGEVRYDAVGYAAPGASSGLSAASPGLAPGSYAEVTALDTGRTIVVAIVGGEVSPGRVASLSASAAAALGLTGDTIAVRVRKVVPTAQDIVQLRSGIAASFRADAPASLLVALRKKLPSIATGPSQPRRPTTTVRKPAAQPAPVAVVKLPTTGYVVQVAALSSAARAATVAQAVGGSIVAGPPVWRVRLGPYPDAAAAARARADAARKGYPGGQITRLP